MAIALAVLVHPALGIGLLGFGLMAALCLCKPGAFALMWAMAAALSNKIAPSPEITLFGVATTALLPFMVLRIMMSRPNPLQFPLFWPFLAFLLVSGLGVLYTPAEPLLAVRKWVATAVPFLLGLMAWQSWQTETTQRRALKGWLGAMAAYALIGTVLYAAGVPAYVMQDEGVPRAIGLFDHTNAYAEMMTLCLLIALGLVSGTEGRARWGWGLLVLAFAIGLLTTFSKGGWLGFAAGAVLLASKLPFQPKKRLLGWLAGASALSVTVALVFGVDPLARFTTNSSMEYRYGLWDFLQDGISAHSLLGQGMWSSRAILQQVDPYGIDTAHNAFLSVLFDHGAIGLIAFLWFVGAYLWHAWRAQGLLAAGVFAGFGAMLIQSLADTNFLLPILQLPFWFAFAMMPQRPSKEGARRSEMALSPSA